MEENLSFKDKYILTDTWQEKAVLISLYHTIMCTKFKWTVTDTAEYFDVSIGLVSENIRLAKELDGINKEKMMKCKTRESGLKLIERRHYVRMK